MTNLKRLVGAIAILATTTVGASASTLGSSRNYNVESHFGADTLDSIGVSQATGWNSSNPNKSLAQTANTSNTSQVSATQADGWNFTSINDITFKKDGQLVKGWSKGGDNVEWRFYDKSTGIMKTGWLNDNGTWYYLQADGSMAHGIYIDGYWLGYNGVWDKSKDDSTRQETTSLDIYNDASLSSHIRATDAQFAQYKSQGKLEVSVNHEQTSGGYTVSGLCFYLK